MGEECLGCHNGADATKFTVGGTLYDQSGKGIAGAEVRLVGANSTKPVVMCTDSGGNFILTTSWSGPAKVGVRNASNKTLMVGDVKAGEGGCNSCHKSGADDPIHLP